MKMQALTEFHFSKLGGRLQIQHVFIAAFGSYLGHLLPLPHCGLTKIIRRTFGNSSPCPHFLLSKETLTIINPIDTGRKLNVLCMFNLRPVSTRERAATLLANTKAYSRTIIMLPET